MIRGFSGVLAVVLVLAAGVVAQAAYVPLLQNVTTGQAIFYDDFESYDLYSAPNNCGPAGATWSAPTVLGSSSVGVWNTTYGGLTGGEGDQCLLLDRVDQACWITAYGDASLSGSGETVKASLLFYNFNAETSLYFNQGDTQLLQIGLWGGNGTSDPGIVKVVAPDGSAWIDTGFTFPNEAAPAWTKLEVTHVNGTDQFAISVNDGTPFTATGYASGNLNALMFKPDANYSTGLFDAVEEVPEPATLGLLVSGVLGLLAYAWKKRR